VYGPPVAEEETPQERADRELIELLNELRVVLPGVQVLFAFLLAVPVANGWKRITPFQRDVFFVALLATTVSTALLIAPSSYHRLRFRHVEKERLVFISNRLVLAGLAALLVAIVASVLLVTDYIFEKSTAVATAVAIVVVFLGLWYGLPLYGVMQERRRARS
jgi:hypothetical protein